MIDFKDVIIKETSTKKLEDGKLLTEFEIFPLPRGYGHTLGTSLRRVALSSIEGYAITSVRINGLDHEFSTIPGVLENVLDIVLTLKKIRFKVKGNLPDYVILLNWSGKTGEVKAGDFETPGEVEIVNKDLKIATVTDKKAKLIIEAVLEKGMGYKLPNEQIREEVGRIPLDAVFAPVKVVAYEVLPVAKQGKVEFDKLVISIETDGTITPRDALAQAIKNLINLYTHLDSVMEALQAGQPIEPKKPERAKPKAKAQTPLSKLGLDTRIVNNLMSNGISTVEELEQIHKDDLMQLKGIGEESVKKILKALEEFKKKQ